jgi:allophanate hydrolase
MGNSRDFAACWSRQPARQATTGSTCSPNTTPWKPGPVRDPNFHGDGIEVEVWSLAPDAFGRFATSIPAPLGIGKVTLVDGRQISGFLCEDHAIKDAREITGFGGWRGFLRE